MDEFEVTIEPEKRQANVIYIHGLHLEGADWDANKRLIVEIEDRRRFVPFPAFRVHTRKTSEKARKEKLTVLNFGVKDKRS